MFEVKKEILEATLNYLATKPFNEVAQLIQALQGSKEISEETVIKKDIK